MTRINCIPVRELTRQHLVAEYRELPRIFKQAQAAFDRGEQPDDQRNPQQYVLGTGHVRFFYPRLGFLRQRHAQLVAEMARRSYTANLDCSSAGLNLPAAWQRNWTPTPNAMALNRARIQLRLGKAA